MRGKLISAEMFLSFPPLSPGDRIRKRKILQLFFLPLVFFFLLALAS